MPAVLFVLKWLMKLFAIGVILKSLAWVFDVSFDEEKRETVGWFSEVRARPSLLLKPLCVFVLLPLFTYASLYWALHSPHPIALLLKPWLMYVWVVVKWMLIVFTTVGLNWLLYIIYVKSEGDGQDKSECIASLLWPFPLWVYNPLLGIQLMVFLNMALAYLIYRELPPHWQVMLSNLV